MKPYQHLWSMTALVSTLLIGNIGVQLVKAQQPPQPLAVVSAREFRLVNDKNQAVATMSLSQNGSPQIALFDSGLTRRLELSVDDNRVPGIVLFDEAGKTNLKLTQVEYRGYPSAPQIELYDSGGTVLGRLGLNPNGKSELVLSTDKKGGVALKSDSLIFYGADYSKSTALFPYNGKSPGLAFSDGQGRFVWTAPPQQGTRKK